MDLHIRAFGGDTSVLIQKRFVLADKVGASLFAVDHRCSLQSHPVVSGAGGIGSPFTTPMKKFPTLPRVEGGRSSCKVNATYSAARHVDIMLWCVSVTDYSSGLCALCNTFCNRFTLQANDVYRRGGYNSSGCRGSGDAGSDSCGAWDSFLVHMALCPISTNFLVAISTSLAINLGGSETKNRQRGIQEIRLLSVTKHRRILSTATVLFHRFQAMTTTSRH